MERERRLDVNKLTIEQIDELSAQIGERVRGMCDQTADKINQLLTIYGLRAKVAIVFEPLEKKEETKQS